MSVAESWMPDAVPDAELAVAARGDPAALAAIYDRYGDRLHDFCVGVLRDRDAAADCVQEAFCIAATRLGQLREPERLRPWLYAIARHEALRRLRARDRERPVDEVPETRSPEDGPEELAARLELADLVARAAGGLGDRDRVVLDLHYRHGLDGAELAAALGVSTSHAHTLTTRLRTSVERSLGALLVARRSRQECPALATLLEGWDGEMTVLMRKRIARHIDRCATCETDRRALVSPRALLGSAPTILPAPWWLRDQVQAHAAPHLPGATAGGAAAGGAAAGGAASGGAGSSWWPAGLGHAGIAGLSAPVAATGAAVASVGLAAGVWLAVGAAVPSDAPATPTPLGNVAVVPPDPPRFQVDMPTQQLPPPPGPADPPPTPTTTTIVRPPEGAPPPAGGLPAPQVPPAPGAGPRRGPAPGPDRRFPGNILIAPPTPDRSTPSHPPRTTTPTRTPAHRPPPTMPPPDKLPR